MRDVATDAAQRRTAADVHPYSFEAAEDDDAANPFGRSSSSPDDLSLAEQGKAEYATADSDAFEAASPLAAYMFSRERQNASTPKMFVDVWCFDRFASSDQLGSEEMNPFGDFSGDLALQLQLASILTRTDVVRLSRSQSCPQPRIALWLFLSSLLSLSRSRSAVLRIYRFATLPRAALIARAYSLLFACALTLVLPRSLSFSVATTAATTVEEARAAAHRLHRAEPVVRGTDDGAVRFLLCTVAFYANHAHNLTRSP